MSFFTLPKDDAANYETLAPAASTALTSNLVWATSRPSGSQKAKTVLITVTGQPCRFRVDGGTPTATVGNVLAVNDGLFLNTHDQILNFRIIETAATASVQVTYFY